MIVLPERTPPPGTRAADWEVGDFRMGSPSEMQVAAASNGVLALSKASLAGSYTSPVKKADFSFNAMGASWRADLPPGSGLSIEVRSSQDGVSWSDWSPMKEIEGHCREGKGERCYTGLKGEEVTTSSSSGHTSGPKEHASELLIDSGAYLQFQVEMQRASADLQPTLSRVTLTYIDSSSGPKALQAQAAAQRRQASLVRPAIISRAEWGANEGYRFYQGRELWPPEYESVKKAIVHHTVTKNDDTDPAATVRAIYYYHAVSRGWGDIGYNFLVDRNGNIYEGRYGGDNVVAGHTFNFNYGSVGIAVLGTYSSVAPPSAAEDGLVRFLAWESYKYGIDPLGSSYFVDRILANVSGHREADGTSCPGDSLFDRLPDIRYRVWSSVPLYGVIWGTHNTPSTMTPGQTVGVRLQLTNSGTKTWTATTRPPFDLGYHWYDSRGVQYVQERADDRRSPLPRDVLPGESVTVDALLTSPRAPGIYTLKWDMVQEGVTWFADRGSPTLDVRITVREFTPTPTATPTITPTPTPTSTPTPTATPTVPSLSISLGQPGTLVWPGQVVTYTTIYTNLGSLATGVMVRQALPGNVAYLDSRPTLSSEGPSLYTRRIDSMPGGTSLSHTITLRMDPSLKVGDSVILGASISDDGARGPDFDPTDNAFQSESKVACCQLYLPWNIKAQFTGW